MDADDATGASVAGNVNDIDDADHSQVCCPFEVVEAEIQGSDDSDSKCDDCAYLFFLS